MIRSADAAGDREGDADIAARGREDRGVDADHLAVEVERRTTGVAAVHRRVDLDEVVIRTGADIAAAGRHDARGHGAAEAERVADGDNPVADADLVLGELDVGELAVRVVDLEQREVGLLVDADDLGLVLGVVVEDDGDRLALVDDVVVGDDVAVLGDDEARAEAGRIGALPAELAIALVVVLALAVAELLEEALHRRVLVAEELLHLVALPVGGGLLDLGLHPDADHGRTHLLDHVGEADRLDALDADGVGIGRRLRQEDRLARNRAAQCKDGDRAEECTLPQRPLRLLRRDLVVHVGLVSRPLGGAVTLQRLSSVNMDGRTLPATVRWIKLR